MGDRRPDGSPSRVATRYALRIAPTPGVQTYVTEDSAKGIPPTPESREPDSAAPLPGSATPGGAGRDIGRFEYSTPDSDSEITPRTLGVPGEQYGNPTNVLNNYITRRTMTAAERVADRWVEAYNVGERGGPRPTKQHRQPPVVRRKEHREYRGQKRQRTRKALKRYHAFCKRNRQCLKQREMQRENPSRYRRRAPVNKDGGDIILYDQWNPANNEITQPGDDVNYEAEGPSTYRFKPDEKKGVPPGHEQPSNQTENVPPGSSRVIPDQMKDTLRDQLTYMKGAGGPLRANEGLTSKERRVVRVVESALPTCKSHCWKATEVLYHLLDGRRAGYKALEVSHEGSLHWFLRTPRGAIIDVTASQFDDPNVPYEDGRPQPGSSPETLTQSVHADRLIDGNRALRMLWLETEEAARLRRIEERKLKTACVVAVSEVGGLVALLKVRDRNYVPRIKVVREMVAGTEIAHVFDTWTGWSEGVNEHGIGVVSSALLVEVDEGQKKVPTGDSGTGRKIREILGARTMDAAIEIIMGNLVKGCTFISDGKKTVLVEYDGNPQKGGTEPELHTLKSGVTMARTNHGVFLEGAGYTDEYQDGSDLKSSEVRKETAEKALDAAKDVEDVASALARSRKKDRSDPFNAVRATDNMTTSSQIVTVPAERRMLVYLVPEEVDFVGIDNELPKGRKPKVKIQVFGFKDWDSEDPKAVELKGDLEVFRLFTYGSMMGRPSHSKDVIRSYKATLSGHHRAYNRSSQSRDGISVIGTEPGGKLEGLIHEYPVSMGHRVLGQVDRREGFRTERPEDKNSYIRHQINVKTPDGIARAIVYLSNPDGPNYNKPLTPAQAAKEVLAHPKAQKYLRGLVKAVEEHGIKAPYIKKVDDRVSKGAAVKKASRIAATIDEILRNTGPSVMQRVQGVRASGHRFNPKKGMWTFKVLGSQGKTYTVRVKGIRKGNVARLEKAQVRVSCSCPYFRWQGPEHWAKKHDYLYGRQVGTASDPSIKDPKGRHWACKHAVAALRMARNYRFSSGEDGWSLDGPVVAMADPSRIVMLYELRTAMLPEQVTDERDHPAHRDEPEDGDGSKLPGDAEEDDG